MDFRFTDEQQLWYETLHAFMDKEVGRDYTRQHDESREFPYEVYKRIADNGWLGLLIPQEYGGMAADPIMFAIFCEAIAKFSLDTAACVMTSMFTATNISHHGTDAQREQWVTGIAAGTTKVAFAITEPGAGSNSH
ncbi:MAG: acyl-CoA dehydrogenase family protein, partial [Acidimicrobiia bacterium]